MPPRSTVREPVRGHTVHIDWEGEGGRWRVSCDQMCDLGSSARTSRWSKAVARAELHEMVVKFSGPL